jgi:hypothetical protein
VIIINKIEILNIYRKHIVNVCPKILRSLELLRMSCKSFYVHVLV